MKLIENEEKNTSHLLINTGGLNEVIERVPADIVFGLIEYRLKDSNLKYKLGPTSLIFKGGHVDLVINEVHLNNNFDVFEIEKKDIVITNIPIKVNEGTEFCLKQQKNDIVEIKLHIRTMEKHY